jgi:hypothetical protein
MPTPVTVAKYGKHPSWANPNAEYDLRDIARLKALIQLPPPPAGAECVSAREATRMLKVRPATWKAAMVAYHVVRFKGDDPFRSMAWMPTSVDANDAAFKGRKWIRDMDARFAVADIERLREGVEERERAAAVRNAASVASDITENLDWDGRPGEVTCLREYKRRPSRPTPSIGQLGWRPSKWWRRAPYGDFDSHWQVLTLMDGGDAIAQALGTGAMSVDELKQALPAFECNVAKMFAQLDHHMLWFSPGAALDRILTEQRDDDGCFHRFARLEDGRYRVATAADRSAEVEQRSAA